MYHCHVQFYLLTRREEDFNSIRAMPPLKAFTHDFFVSGSLQSQPLGQADVILGPIGIVIADAMLGEITPRMAAAVAQSGAKRILIPFDHCDNIIVGVPETSMKNLVRQAVETLLQITS